MDFSLFLLASIVLWELSDAIQCYKCDAQLLENSVPLCGYFDGSAKFIVDCPSSTGCVKKETMLDRFGETTRSIERGCAMQTMSGEQEKINGQWQYVNNIHEVYEVGCQEDPVEFGKLTRTTKCFCRGDLCNGSGYRTSSLLTLVSMVVTLLILH